TCRSCGATWSYFETGSVRCPECGSPRSTGRGERSLHTDRDATLDLTRVRERAAADLDEALDVAGEESMAYLRQRGFVRGGDLAPLDETYVLAQELRHASTLAGLDRDDDDRAYLLALLDGDRPSPTAVPAAHRESRGLAVAAAVRDYRDELRTWLSENDCDGARDRIETLGAVVDRVRALDGDVDPSAAETLLETARSLGAHCRDGGDADLATVDARLDDLR
ncbi:MAG: TFIIB-type zinc ribbon-containing protein, partial [Halanaeroarchaeum sp.]